VVEEEAEEGDKNNEGSKVGFEIVEKIKIRKKNSTNTLFSRIAVGQHQKCPSGSLWAVALIYSMLVYIQLSF